MSGGRRPLAPVEAVCRKVGCGHCGARPGQPCTTESGARKTVSHAWRFDTQTRAGLLPLKENAG